jgi:hypothetical protein
MVNGFFLYLLLAAVLAPLLQRIPTALDGLSNQIKVSALMGLVATILIDMGDVVWWYISFEWKLYMSIFHTISWVIMTVVLCRFILPKRG